MRTRRPAPPQETRAEIARRRLAQLTATFEASHEDGSAEHGLEAGGHPQRRLELADVETAERPDDEEPARAPSRLHRAVPAGGSRTLSVLHVRVLATVAVAAGVLLTWWLLAERPRTADVGERLQVSARADNSAGAPAAESEPAEIVVDVAGKVKRPGIVTVPSGSRVHEAIEKAGGMAGKVKEPGVNLARVLVDGEQIVVGMAATDPAAADAPGGGAASALVNLNTATTSQLEELPGVGPVTARSIVDWRTENGSFASVDDLIEVSGIGERTLETLRDLVTV